MCICSCLLYSLISVNFHISYIIATTISAPVTVVYKGILTNTMASAIASTLVRSTRAVGWQDLSLLSLILIDTMRGVIGFAALPQQQPLAQISLEDRVPVTIQASANYAKSPPQMSYSLSELSLSLTFYTFDMCWCNGICFLILDSDVVILGDFNAWARKDHTTYSDAIGKFGKGNNNSNGELLLNFCTQTSVHYQHVLLSAR